MRMSIPRHQFDLSFNFRNEIAPEYKKTNIRAVVIQDDDYHDIKNIRVLKFIEIGDNRENNNFALSKVVEEKGQKENDENGKIFMSVALIIGPDYELDDNQELEKSDMRSHLSASRAVKSIILTRNRF